MNLSKLAAGWKVFTAGQSMVAAVRGKQAQVAANAIATFLGLLVAFGDSLFGWSFKLDDQMLAALGVVGYGAINWLLTVASTDKIGITGRAAPVDVTPAGPAGGPPESGTGAPDTPMGSGPAEPTAAPAVRPVSPPAPAADVRQFG